MKNLANFCAHSAAYIRDELLRQPSPDHTASGSAQAGYKAPAFGVQWPSRQGPGQHSQNQRWRTPGTCGELLQGHLEGRDFMVNCPINLYSTASARALSKAGVQLNQAAEHAKVLATLQGLDPHLANRFPPHRGMELTVQSTIPRSKGMASSTADAAAAVAAVLAFHRVALNEDEVARLLTSVEPSDCTHYSGISHLDFCTGERLERLPVPTGLKVMVVDCGGEVQTLAFDRARARAVYAKHASRLARALNLMKQGLRSGNHRAVAIAATESTELSQLILPKPALPELQGLRDELGVLGFNCAHSGTVLGLLYSEGAGKEERMRSRLARAFGADLPIIGSFSIIGGGSHAF